MGLFDLTHYMYLAGLCLSERFFALMLIFEPQLCHTHTILRVHSISGRMTRMTGSE